MENPNIEIRFKGEGPSEDSYAKIRLGFETIDIKVKDRVSGEFLEMYFTKETAIAFKNELSRVIDLYDSIYEEE